MLAVDGDEGGSEGSGLFSLILLARLRAPLDALVAFLCGNNLVCLGGVVFVA